MPKTVKEALEKDPKEYAFEERARKYEAEMKPVVEKWGVAPWAALQATNEALTAVPVIKDLWPKQESPS